MSKKKKEFEVVFDPSQIAHTALMLPINGSIDPRDTFEVDESALSPVMPVLPLRNLVLFPGCITSIFIGRKKSRELVKEFAEKGGLVVATAQIDSGMDDPGISDLHRVGVVMSIDKILEIPDGHLTIMVQGHQRVLLGAQVAKEPYLMAEIHPVAPDLIPEKLKDKDRAILSSIKENFIELFELIHGSIPKPVKEMVKGLRNPIYLINSAIGLLDLPVDIKQILLETNDILNRGFRLLELQEKELNMLRLKESLTNKTQREMDRQQKEYFLQQQIRTFQEELGHSSDNEIETLRVEGQKKSWSPEVAEIFQKEIRKAERLNPQSPDFSIQTQYLRTMLSLPWGIYSKDNFDLKKAQRKLNSEHFGLEQVKERILEHLAVLKLKGDLKAPIICLYGPPGVGKTSLGRSIAESLGRKYVRISLGGVHDEAEIRGHRRTYIGAMPGRIIKGLQKAGTSNPVFVLDEIDKLASDYKGDPASALLEVLDPEQNVTFHDNYLDIDYDLSKVLFIATANNIGAISQPLRDRMEMIEVSGYITEEKHQIAKRHLIPKLAEEHGLSNHRVKFSPKAIDTIIEDYTRESGVRDLGKKISTVMRKIAWQIAFKGDASTEVSPSDVYDYLGKVPYSRDKYQGNTHPGVVVGLAWTRVGGEILFVESSLHAGQEFKLVLTGSLGDVMKESAVLALDYIRAHREELGIDEESIKNKEVHIHVPEGAVPKDGPSAGITITTSLVSSMTGRLVRSHIAMTGEITLRGKVLPVGGIREKILAAKRAGIKEIILCRENQKDIEEIKSNYLSGLTFHYVEEISEVLNIALEANNK